jgi:hypothetical protein
MSSNSDMNYVSLSVWEEMVTIILAFSGCGPSEAWKWIDKERYGGWQGCWLYSKHYPLRGMALNGNMTRGVEEAVTMTRRFEVISND